MKKKKIKQSQKIWSTDYRRAKFYHDCCDVIWSDVVTLVNDYMKNQVIPDAKKRCFPEGGITAMKLASKRILKVLASARKESLA